MKLGNQYVRQHYAYSPCLPVLLDGAAMAVERYPTSVFHARNVIGFAVFGRYSQSAAMADINRRFTAGHRFCLFMLQPLSCPFRNMAAAIDNRHDIQPDYCLQAARNVGASVCAFGKKPADYGYFIFPVSIRRR
nr:MAG TPA: hypothetical protein [Inoviridae sp.]